MNAPNTPPRPEYWVLFLSGGKDSTALGLEWLKRHTVDPVTYPLHEVVYCDTWMEFPAMVEHINRLEKIFTDAGIKFTRIKHEKTFEYFMFEYQPERSNPALQGRAGWSWPGPKARWCTAVLKYRLINEHLSKLREKYTVYQLIGLAADEENRLQRDHNQDPTHKHPLVEWGWDEAHCLQYCYDHGFDWGGLYEIFHRVSCWCCPLQSLKELRQDHLFQPSPRLGTMGAEPKADSQDGPRTPVLLLPSDLPRNGGRRYSDHPSNEKGL